MNRQWFLAAVTVCISVLGVLLFLETGIRIYKGDVFSRRSQLEGHGNRIEGPQAIYHSRLGWVPRPGRKEVYPTSVTNIDANTIRVNGSARPPGKAPIVAVGDSFTFGDEVHDHETWPARLEKITGRPVFNGGVFAYGLDQAVLRGEILARAYDPRLVILAAISDDISRAEYSYYWAWKPYFEFVENRLITRNIPVPKGLPDQSRFERLREVLGYSFLAAEIIRRVGPRSWRFSGFIKKTGSGDAVSLALLKRFHAMLRKRGARLIVVALPVIGGPQKSSRLAKLVAGAREAGITVLDLVPRIAEVKRQAGAPLFRPRGHYSPMMNGWVARKIADYMGPESTGADPAR